MDGQAPPGGGSGDDRDRSGDDPFAVRPATDADRERPVRPLAPIGWGRSADVEPAPADRDDARQRQADADEIAAAQEEGIDPAPADAPAAPADDILAGIAPLDPTEDAGRIAPLDQADASADADPADEAPAPVPEPEIAAASGIADELEFAGEPDPGYVPSPVDLPAGTVPADAATSGAPSSDAPSSDAPLAGEVLTGELEADPEPVDDATAEMVLEPIADGDDDLRLPEPDADGAVDSAVVDAELVEEPAPEAPAETPTGDLVDLTPRVDTGLDEDAGVVDDPVEAADAPAHADSSTPAALAAREEVAEVVRPGAGADADAADADADADADAAGARDAGAGADARAHKEPQDHTADAREDPDAAPAPLAPAAAAARAAAMAWAAGSPVAPTATATAAAAAPSSSAASDDPASHARSAEGSPVDVTPEPTGTVSEPGPPDAHDATAALAARADEATPVAPSAPEAPSAAERRDPADPAADHDATAPERDAPVADDRVDRADRGPVASDDEPVDAIALLFGDVAEDADDDSRATEPDRPVPDDGEDRTRVLPVVGAAAAVAGAAAPAAHPDRDASTVAVPAAPRPDAGSPRETRSDAGSPRETRSDAASASASASVPPPYAAPPAPRPPAPRAPVLDAARVPAPPAPASPSRRASGPRGPRRTALWVGGAILLVLLLVGLFYLGQRLASSAAPDAAPVATATAAAEETPTPSPTPTDPVQGPAAAGTQAWDALLGGECLEPYTTPWEEEFTVVDCGSEHHAQMVARVALPQTGDAFPGEDAVRDSADELCIADTVIDYGAARAYEDVQYQSAYPITQDEWTAGDRDAYCFVSRAGGGAFTGSVGKPQPPVVP